MASYSLVPFWDGSWFFGQRFFTPLFPLVVIGLAGLVDVTPRFGLAAATVAVAWTLFLAFNLDADRRPAVRRHDPGRRLRPCPRAGEDAHIAGRLPLGHVPQVEPAPLSPAAAAPSNVLAPRIRVMSWPGPYGRKRRLTDDAFDLVECRPHSGSAPQQRASSINTTWRGSR